MYSWEGGRGPKKSTLCWLLIMLTILDDPLPLFTARPVQHGEDQWCGCIEEDTEDFICPSLIENTQGNTGHFQLTSGVLQS